MDPIILSGLIILAVLIISALPLNFAVKLLGGKSSIIKVILVNFIVSVASTISSYFGIKWWLWLILLLLIYKVMFSLSWIKAFFAWVLQAVIAVILLWLIIVFTGMAAIGIPLLF